MDSVEDVLSRGDQVAVRVVEVDRERGRIGLRLADDPEVAGKSVEELVGVGGGGSPGPRGGREGAPRRSSSNGRERSERGRRRDSGGGSQSGGLGSGGMGRGSGRPRHGRERD